MNANHKAIRRGYAKIAMSLGSKMDVYRAVQYNYGLIHPSNWQMERYISASLNTGHMSNQKFGLPTKDGYFDPTDIETGDVFTDGSTTYIVGEIPLFEPPVVIQCFDTFTVSRSVWNQEDEVIVMDMPCNLQAGSTSSVNDGTAYGNTSTKASWEINTHLPPGLIKVGDRVTDSQGHVSSISDLFQSQHGLRIRTVEIK